MAPGIKPIVIITVVAFVVTIALIWTCARLFRLPLPPEADQMETQDRLQMRLKCIIAFLKARSTWILFFAIAIAVWIYNELWPSLNNMATSVTPTFVRGVPQYILMRMALPNLVLSILTLYRYRIFSRYFFRKHLNACGILVCIRCGYDLRGQLEPRCPECGTEFDAKDADEVDQ